MPPKKPSFEKINYLLRPNKNVERKLIIECINSLSDHFDIKNYQYVGLGSIWYVDFILAHKFLNINNMTSIERTRNIKRAEFNKPFKCITVLSGDVSDVLDKIKWKIPSIIWLDYDGSISDSIVDDIRKVTQKSATGSILIFTVNANAGSFGNNLSDREDKLRAILGDLIPHSLEREALSNTKYPTFLSEILLSHVPRVLIDSGRPESFIPLFNFSYSDSSPIITGGGMIANQDDQKSLAECKKLKELNYISEKSQTKINVPHLTPKEKIHLDHLLPSKEPPTMKETKEIGFELSKDYLEAYHRFYRYYPVFAELQP